MTTNEVLAKVEKLNKKSTKIIASLRAAGMEEVLICEVMDSPNRDQIIERAMSDAMLKACLEVPFNPGDPTAYNQACDRIFVQNVQEAIHG